MSLLTMTRGDRQAFLVTLTDSSGGAIDLTGLSVTFTAKRRTTDPDAVFQKTELDGIDVDVGSGGTATVTVEPADTASLTSRALFWDLQIDDGEGDIRTPLSGRLRITPDITISSGGS